MAKELKIGVCGIVCGRCPKYLSKECLGCRPSIEVCPLPACAQNRGVSLCFECQEFPCNLNYEKGPIVKDLLDYFKREK